MDMRSQTRSLHPGACGFGDMRSRFRATAVIKDTLNEVSFLYRCLLLVERFIKVMNGLVMTLKEDKLLQTTAHSQYSLPVEALNVIVELSKSLPVPLR